MRIVNYDSFMEFSESMITRYKFYRLIKNKIQLFMLGRDNIVIFTEIDKPDNKKVMDLVSKGFVEVQLNNTEIQLWGLLTQEEIEGL